MILFCLLGTSRDPFLFVRDLSHDPFLSGTCLVILSCWGLVSDPFLFVKDLFRDNFLLDIPGSVLLDTPDSVLLGDFSCDRLLFGTDLLH